MRIHITDREAWLDRVEAALAFIREDDQRALRELQARWDAWTRWQRFWHNFASWPDGGRPERVCCGHPWSRATLRDMRSALEETAASAYVMSQDELVTLQRIEREARS